MRVTVSEVANQKKTLERLAELVEESTVDPLVRNAAIALTSDCEQRDDECEIRAIFEAVKNGDDRVKGLENGLKYMSDPRWADFFTRPGRTIQQLADGYNGGDCLPGETLLLGAGYRPVAIRDVKVGDLVMGDGKWVRVTSAWDKGVQELLELRLNNGCVLRCTPEHKLFVVPKKRGHGAEHAGPREEAREVRAGDVKPGDDLLTALQLPEGQEQLDPDMAWLLGMHVADGWVGYSAKEEPQRVGISGKDGWRKEGQKTRAEEICERRGWNGRWADKYFMINDRHTAEWLAGCGRGAYEKHLPSMNFDRKTVDVIMEGLAADTDIRDQVFGTVSPWLALQYRVLLRMQGISAHIRRVDNHGGFGKNPIYRVSPRHKHANGLDVRPHARVKSIAEGGAEQTYDIEVEGHRFYLPETDLIVHNCDDHAALICALLGSLGFVTGLRAWGRDKGDYTHVYAVVGYPKIDPNQWVGLDSTVDESEPGWEPEGGHTLTAILDGT